MQRVLDFLSRRFLVLYFIVAAVLLVGFVRAAAARTGNEVLTDCTSTDALQQNSCTMYVSGLVDMGAGAFFCPPPRATYRQARDILVKMLQETPEIRDKGTDVIMIELFGALWPCKQEAPAPRRAPI